MFNKDKKAKSKSSNTLNIVIISSLAYLILGFIMVLWPESVGTALCYILGTVLAVYGLFNIISFFIGQNKNLYFELIVGVIATAFGVFTLISPMTIVNIIFSIIGIIIIIDSLMDIKHSIQLKALGMKYWWISTIVSAAVVTLGLCTIFFPGFFGSFLMMLLGIILIYEGASSFIMIILMNRYTKSVSRQKNIINTDASDIK